VAAISTEGFNTLYEQLSVIITSHENDPARMLVESAWSYAAFALENYAQFTTMFSGVLNDETDYPAFTEISARCYQLLEQIATICQSAGILRPGPVGLMAVTLWSLVHGFVSLVLERQIPPADQSISKRKEMLIQVLNQVAVIHLEPTDYLLPAQ
jgi:hypothetical protein